MPVRIGESGNTTYGFAQAVLADRGFAVMRSPDYDDTREVDELWAVHADGTSLIGSTPLVLLGLLAIVDHLGEDWYGARKRDGLPRGRILDLSPHDLETLPDAHLAEAREALLRLASVLGRNVSCGATRDELVAASRAWVEETRGA